jgi:exosortase family protein XrtG
MTLWLVPLFAIWLGMVVFFRYYRVWLPYYILGTAGCVYWLVLFFGVSLGAETFLAQSVAWAVHLCSGLIPVPTRLFANAPGVLLVLIVAQDKGWTILNIGVESSGVLEISVLASCLLFYPGWSFARRAAGALAGGIAVWSANVLRMLLIVVLLNRLGKDALVLAHTYVGKLVFFVLAVAIFWYLITLPTVRSLGKQLERSEA